MCFMNWDEGFRSVLLIIVYKIISILKRKGIEYKICQMIYQAEGAQVVCPDHPPLPEQVLTMTILRSLVNILWAKTHGPSQPFLQFLLSTIRVEPWTGTWSAVGSSSLTLWCRDAKADPTVSNGFRDVPQAESTLGKMRAHSKSEAVIRIPFMYTFWGTNQHPVSLKKLLKLPRGVQLTPSK